VSVEANKRLGALLAQVIDRAGSSRLVFQRSRCLDDWQVSLYNPEVSVWLVARGDTLEDACHDFITKFGDSQPV
jgi:hypothetical protein